MKELLNILEKILSLFVSLLIGGMMLWVFALVITRYCFNFTPSYGEELARYMFVWVVFLSLPIVAKKGAHMAIEMITARLKGKAAKALRLLADFFSLAFLSLMVWQGTLMVQKSSIQTSAALEVPMSWVYAAIPVGCLIMLANVLSSFIALIRTPADKL
ncbi:MAG: TRAP transporter small permease [Desulfovibrio sp.]|jgi:TRAP-type C4-dicarboxylate transport system permease small subunit|nr:TRAP transporter small permease [Desulfovibrio sp.]